MLTPEPNTPPPKKRRRRRPFERKPTAAAAVPPHPPSSPPPDLPAPSPDLATDFHGLRPAPGGSAVVRGGGDGTAALQGSSKEKRVEREQVGRREEQKVDHRSSPAPAASLSLPSPALRRPVNPISAQLLEATSLSSSSNAAFAFPPAAQSRLLTIRADSPLAPLLSSTSSAAAGPPLLEQPNAVAGPAPKSTPPPSLPAATTLSPATLLRTRRGSVHGRVPDPHWAAKVLEPIVRAEAEQAEREENDERGKQKKDKGKGKQREGWKTFSEGSEGRDDRVPLSVDEFILNVLPKTKARERPPKGDNKRASRSSKALKANPRKRQRPAYTSSTSSAGSGNTDGALFSPSEFPLPPTPASKTLHRASTFLGAVDLQNLTEGDKTRLLRRGEREEGGGGGGRGVDKLSMDAPSRTAFGNEDKEAEEEMRSRKRRRGDVEGDRIRRLPPGKDVNAPFITGIGETAFLRGGTKDAGRPRAGEGGGGGGRKRLRTLGQLEEEVDRIMVEGGEEEMKVEKRLREPATLVRRGGGRYQTLALGRAEEAGAAATQHPRFATQRSRPLQPKDGNSFLRKPPPNSCGVKYRFIPQRLPPPRRLNPLPAHLVSGGARQPPPAARSPSPHLSSSRVEKADVPVDLLSCATKAPAAAPRPLQTKQRQPQTDFRFITGAKAKKALTVDVRSMLDGCSNYSSPAFPISHGGAVPSVYPPPPLHTSPAAHGRTRNPAPSFPSASGNAIKASAFTTTSRRPRKRLRPPAEADSDPAHEPKRKKRFLLRRLTTRPEFVFPSAIAEEQADAAETEERAHESSHEFAGGRGAGRGRSVSLPPMRLSGVGGSRVLSIGSEEDTESSGAGKADEAALPSLRGAQISPELYGPREGKQDIDASNAPSSSAASSLPRPSAALHLEQPLPSISSGIWTHVPSFASRRSRSPAFHHTTPLLTADDNLRGGRWSGLLTYDPYLDGSGVPSAAERDVGGGGDEGEEGEEEPPASAFLTGEHEDVPESQPYGVAAASASEEEMSTTSPASEAAVEWERERSRSLRRQRRG